MNADHNEVESILGSISLSRDERQALADSLAVRWPNVMRHRREVAIDQLPGATEPVPWYKLARRPCDDRASRPSRQLSYAAGDYYLQDAGSLLALSATAADTSGLSGRLICDLCAAPGGKATALVEAIGDQGFVLANEPIRSRLPALVFNLARTGSDRYAVSALDPQRLAERLGGVFDLVLVDAPCSGQALLSRGRQSASAMSAKQIAHSAARQRRILSAATGLLRPGGQLIYSTCTFAEAENEDQVRWLIDENRVIPRQLDWLSQYESNCPACYRLWPHRHPTAGSFAASLTGCTDTCPSPHRSRRRQCDAIPAEMQAWFGSLAERIRPSVMDSIIVGWPVDAPGWVEQLAVRGPELAHRTGRTWKPSHAAALRRGSSAVALQSIAVDAETARQFLSGQSIGCDASGWQVVTWSGRPLGWTKSNGRVGKNHLPTAARMT